ncbi:hypothetical protein WJX81_000582 [Elliptochloris bilobata]|uniref:DUF2428 domain-containing protein n=1 Tax=Elliptochloris bilobata TaxID=381761 RepID=A0AAW1S7Z5_9CHLO
MSQKLPQQQRQAQWSPSGSVFPAEYVAQAKALSTDRGAPLQVRELAGSLARLASLRSSVAEVEALKEICSGLMDVPDADGHHNGSSPQGALLALLAQLLFLEHSRPLHRPLLACVRRLPPLLLAPFARAFEQQVLGEAATAAAPAGACVPQLRGLMRPCCVEAMGCIATGLARLLRVVQTGDHLTPTTTDDMQDAVAALYALLQLRGEGMCESSAGRSAVAATADAMLTLLQCATVSREAMAAAAVALAATAALPDVPAAWLAAWKDACWLLDEGDADAEPSSEVHDEDLALELDLDALPAAAGLHSGFSGDMALPLLTPALRARLMAAFWATWEDPLTQTVSAVRAAFDALMDVQEAQQALAERAHGGGQHPAAAAAAAAMGRQSAVAFQEAIALELMALGPQHKGRIAPLRALTSRLGASRLLMLRPKLLWETIRVHSQDALCTPAAGLVEALLGSLRHECISGAGGHAAGMERWREAWLPPMLAALTSRDARLRANVAHYVLPLPLAMDSNSLPVLLERLGAATPSHDANGNLGSVSRGRVAALVAVLKAARALGLVDALDEVRLPGSGPYALPEALLQSAVASADEGLAIDAVQMACTHQKATVLPSALELRLVALALSLGLRCGSQELQQNWAALLARLLRRQHLGVHAALVRWRARAPPDALPPDEAEEAADEMADMQRQAAFSRWLTRLLLAACYPGSPFERKYLALRLLAVLLACWQQPVATGAKGPKMQGFKAGVAGRMRGIPAPGASMVKDGPSGLGVMEELILSVRRSGVELFCAAFLSDGTVRMLLGAMVDPWDKLRNATAVVLNALRPPLPGLEAPPAVAELLSASRRLLASLRVRETDAGARLVSLVFHKYVLGLGWQITCLPGVSVTAAPPPPGASGGTFEAALAFLDSLVAQLEADLAQAESEVEAACVRSLPHGSLLVLRYLAPALPWALLEGHPGRSQAARVWLQRLLRALVAVAGVALVPLSSAVNSASISAEEVDTEDGDCGGDELCSNGDDASSGGLLAPRAQVLISGCWLTLKEVSLLLGTLARCVPLSGEAAAAGGLLDAEQLADMGERFQSYLAAIKHNGAIDKTQAGFIALAARLLRENAATLNGLPRRWLGELLARTAAPGQGRDDVLRRSAGLPAAIVALFLAEPGNQARKVLLETGMAELLRQAAGGGAERAGPWPRVHAFNTLRSGFIERTLATSATAYVADGVMAAVRGAAAQEWEVRNAANLCFAALVTRIVGYNNIHKGEVPRRAIGGAELFLRYPALHPFLLGELQAAVAALGQRGAPLHPSLFPVLLLLSRLKPALDASMEAAEDSLTPAAFAPVVRCCARARQAAVRHLAARALVPLVPPSALAATLAAALRDVPATPRITCHNEAHGALLQACLLLESASAMPAPSPVAVAMLTAAAPLLTARAWLLGPACAEAVAAALARGEYEVRAATLKALRRRCIGGAAPAWLPALLQAHLRRERHHKSGR